MKTKIISNLLRELADKIDAKTSVITEEEAMEIFSIIAHEPLSKEQACDYLNVSRATFDNYIRNGYLPKGRKRKGYNELVWYKDEISNPFKT